MVLGQIVFHLRDFMIMYPVTAGVLLIPTNQIAAYHQVEVITLYTEVWRLSRYLNTDCQIFIEVLCMYLLFYFHFFLYFLLSILVLFKLLLYGIVGGLFMYDLSYS